MKRVLVTGGAGFIGSNFVRHLLKVDPAVVIVNLDALTYAGNPENLDELSDPERHHFVHGDINDRALVDGILRRHAVDTIVHFAAETHVDRSIEGPITFFQTNVLGTATVLEAANSIQAVEDRQGLMISSPEEIACRQGYIDERSVRGLAQAMPETHYRTYLPSLLEDRAFGLDQK